MSINLEKLSKHLEEKYGITFVPCHTVPTELYFAKYTDRLRGIKLYYDGKTFRSRDWNAKEQEKLIDYIISQLERKNCREKS